MRRAVFADADNAYLGTAKAPTVSLSFDTTSDRRGNLGSGLQAIGREASLDEAGSNVPLEKNPPGMPSKAQFTAYEAAQRPGPPGDEKTGATASAMARLMGK